MKGRSSWHPAMSSSEITDLESRHAQQVNEAMETLRTGNVPAAEAMLREVVAQTPVDYSHVSEDPDGSLSIRFWDQQSFVHYVLWQKEHGAERSLHWIENAYPRAYYYLG